MIDQKIYAGYMIALSERLRFPLSDAANALYYKTLSEKLTTEEFATAADIVFSEYDDFGFPPPKVFFAALASTAPPVDSEAIQRRISALGTYNPNSGWIYPRIETVRDKLGDAIADAYAAAGETRMFSENETTRDIASRAFSVELTAAQKQNPSQPLLAAPKVNLLGAGEG